MVSTHLKNISQVGSFPQVGAKIKNTWNHHLDIVLNGNPSISQQKNCKRASSS